MSNVEKLTMFVVVIIHIIGACLLFTHHIYLASLIIGGFYVYAVFHNRVVDWLRRE